MSRCENSGVCSFFQNNMGAMPSLVRRMKEMYCEKEKEHCARYMVKAMVLKGYTLPENADTERMENMLRTLFPNDMVKAREVINSMVL